MNWVANEILFFLDCMFVLKGGGTLAIFMYYWMDSEKIFMHYWLTFGQFLCKYSCYWEHYTVVKLGGVV